MMMPQIMTETALQHLGQHVVEVVEEGVPEAGDEWSCEVSG